MTEKHIRLLAVGATLTAVGMYVAYIPQIQDNLAGHKGNPVQPLCAAVNCTLWVVYALSKKLRDWPVAIANMPGIVLGLVAFATSF